MSDAYVWIDPARKSGEPCLGGHRVDVEMVIGAVWDSDVTNAQDLWCLTRAQVLVACWYAGAGNVVRLHGKGGKYIAKRGPWRKRWGAWAAEVHQALWQSATRDCDAIPDPPTKAAPFPLSGAGHHTEDAPRATPSTGDLGGLADPAADVCPTSPADHPSEGTTP